MMSSRHPMLARAGLAFALVIAVSACDGPTIPPVEEEEEEEEENPGESIAARPDWRQLFEISDTARSDR